MEAWEGASCFLRVPVGDCAQELHKVASYPFIIMKRSKVAVKYHRINGVRGNGGYEQALSGTSAEQPCQEIRETRAEEQRSIVERTAEWGEKCFKGIASREYQARNALGIVRNY